MPRTNNIGIIRQDKKNKANITKNIKNRGETMNLDMEKKIAELELKIEEKKGENPKNSFETVSKIVTYYGPKYRIIAIALFVSIILLLLLLGKFKVFFNAIKKDLGLSSEWSFVIQIMWIFILILSITQIIKDGRKIWNGRKAKLGKEDLEGYYKELLKVMPEELYEFMKNLRGFVNKKGYKNVETSRFYYYFNDREISVFPKNMDVTIGIDLTLHMINSYTESQYINALFRSNTFKLKYSFQDDILIDVLKKCEPERFDTLKSMNKIVNDLKSKYNIR